MKLTSPASGCTSALAVRVLLSVCLFVAPAMFAAEPASPAAGAINALGIDLLHKAGKPDGNALLSPYSIQSALAMTYAGAEGGTRTEMAKVLHYPNGDAQLHGSFAALRQALDDIATNSARAARQRNQWGATNDLTTLTVANRLFGQTGYQFRDPFLALVKDRYGTPLERLDFVRDPAGATRQINSWVENQTRQRIRNLIPADTLNSLTRLVLVNAFYLKAPWAQEFVVSATRRLPFHAAGGRLVNVPTMKGGRGVSYSKRDGFSMLAIPYMDGDLQFLIFLPDKMGGLAALEKKLTPGLLAEGATLPCPEVILYLPKFKLEPPVLSLANSLQALGMKSAFDVPRGSANFDRMAPRQPGGYLSISAIFHKTFLSLDEKGTEAAAATAIEVNSPMMAIAKPKPVEVRVDRPFVFAIQHRPSGACLFLGHVTDPR